MRESGSVEPEGLLTGLRVRSIALGVAVDQLLTVLTSLPLIAAFGSDEMFSEDEGVSRAAFDELFTSTDFLLASLIVGLACSVVGAFMGARHAGSEFLRHGGWIAVASLALGLLLQLVASGEDRIQLPLWVDLGGALLLLPAGLLGGAIAQRVARNESGSDPGENR